MAHSFLNELIDQLEEMKPLVTLLDLKFLELSQNQLMAMKRTIDHSEEFFNNYFLNKTEGEVKKWIEEEAKKW